MTNWFAKNKRLGLHAATLLMVLVASPPGQARDWSYTVRAADSMGAICSQYLRGPQWSSCPMELGAYNKLQSPYHLQQGAVIKIPYAWLKRPPQPATLVFATGEVSYFPAQVTAITSASGAVENPQPVAAGRPMPADGKIHMGDRITTFEGNARVQFADGSELVVRPHSDILFDRLAVFDGYAYVDTLLILKQGATLNRVEKQAGGNSRFSIATPAGVAAVRGTEFRVSTEQTIMRSEVLAGVVAVNDVDGLATQAVTQGYGLKSEAGVPPPPPRELLPAPQWQDVDAGRISLPYNLVWQAVTGAQRYMLDIVDTAGLMKVETVTGNSVQLQGLALGEYQLALRAIDSDGLQGLDATLGITVLPAVPRPQVLQAGLVSTSGTRASLTWPAVDEIAGYRVEVSRDADFTSLVDEVELTRAGYELWSWRPLYIRVQAFSTDGRNSEYSDIVRWQPTADYSPYIFSFFSVILAIVSL